MGILYLPQSSSLIRRSCFRFRCCCWRRAWWLFRDTILLCTHDAYAHGSCQWQGFCLLGGLSLVPHSLNGSDMLQGGYNFRSISKSALAVTKTLMGEPPDRLLSTSPSELAASTVRRVMMTQSRYWRCMYPKEPQELSLWTDRLHGEYGLVQSWMGLIECRYHSPISIQAAL